MCWTVRGDRPPDAPTALEGRRIGIRDVMRLYLVECDRAEEGDQVVLDDLGVSLVRLGRDFHFDSLQPRVQKLCDGLLLWLDVASGRDGGDQSRAFLFGLTLRALECVPFAFALAGGVVAQFEDDGVALAALYDRALHLS